MRSGGQESGVGIREQMPAISAAASMAERLIVALDVPTLEGAARVMTTMAPAVRWFKVGSELFTAVGPRAVTMILERGGKVFLDLKFHDIPRTVAAAVGAAARLGVHMMNVHIGAGEETLRAAVQAIGGVRGQVSGGSNTRSVEVRPRAPDPRPMLLGVTRLTRVKGHPGIMAQVAYAAARAKWSGQAGVIASAREAAAIKP